MNNATDAEVELDRTATVGGVEAVQDVSIAGPRHWILTERHYRVLTGVSNVFAILVILMIIAVNAFAIVTISQHFTDYAAVYLIVASVGIALALCSLLYAVVWMVADCKRKYPNRIDDIAGWMIMIYCYVCALSLAPDADF
jgi:Na+-transporting methylmalonyl-CoA/oxaloacetate decarboxylase gamma subunit